MKKAPLIKFVLSIALLAGAATKAEAIPTLDENSPVAQKLRLPIYKWEDPSVPHRGNIVGIHGLTFYSKSFDDLAKFFASKGYTFYALDMRGFGKWKVQGEKYGGDRNIHFDSTHEDFIKLLQYLRTKHPGKSLIAVGESLGANVAMQLAANRSDLLDGIILSSPSYKMRLSPRPRLLVDVPRSLIFRNKPVDWTPYIKPLLTEDRGVLERLMADNSLRREFSPMELMKGLMENRRGIKTAEKLPPDFPILILSGEKDEMFRSKLIPKMVAKINNKNSEVWVLEGRGHLLLEHQPVREGMAKIFTGWLAKTTSATSRVARATEPGGGVNLFKVAM